MRQYQKHVGFPPPPPPIFLGHFQIESRFVKNIYVEWGQLSRQGGWGGGSFLKLLFICVQIAFHYLN